MSRGLNKVLLIGNVGQDPEFRQARSGTKIANLSLATNRTWKDKAGNKQEGVEWHRLTFFDRLAEIVEEYVGKGDRLYVEGRIQYSQTEGDDGVTRYWTDIIVRELVMLGDSGGASGGGASSGGAPSRKTSRAAGSSADDTPLSEPDDDLPF